LADISSEAEPKMATPDLELNRALDGGLVPGSLILMAGEPGIGKSTLLLQTALRLASEPVLYVTGEESEKQVKLRADRLPYQSDQLFLLAETELESILAQARQLEPALLLIDSIQTLYSRALDSSPGSVSQVRECTLALLRFAKDCQTAVILVSHVTKDGLIAGPKVLEHMVDTVLEFEGDRHYNYRLLRATKNRFGATPELGIYEMRGTGLHEVSNPSELFLHRAAQPLPGVAVAATLQGMRPLLLEVQALTANATYGTPQRTATGYELRRLQMLLAVLEKKCGLVLGNKDVFVNLVGGLRVEDPALDLAVVVALVSSLYEVPLSATAVFAGEVGLTGEVRLVGRMEPRIVEAEKLGFTDFYGPTQRKALERPPKHLQLHTAETLFDLLQGLGLYLPGG
jgi:DNA repair protein RadA/Sms